MSDQVPIGATAGRRSASGVAFLYAVPIGTLGGLIGLGGAEFRLPVLLGPLGYPARRAVPLNLAVSLVTIWASLAIRSRSLSLASVEPLAPALLALVAGAVVAAVAGTALVHRLSDERLERAIQILLLVIGVALIVEGFLLQEVPGFLPVDTAVRAAAGLLFGLLIGLVSSLLGVAGGEVIIPTLVFAYGADIKTAGTASLLVSLPAVAVGIARHARRGGYDRAALAGAVVADGCWIGDRGATRRSARRDRPGVGSEDRSRRGPNRLCVAHRRRAPSLGGHHDGFPVRLRPTPTMAAAASAEPAANPQRTGTKPPNAA